MNLGSVSKAVAGALVAALVGYVAKYGVHFDPLVVDAMGVLATAGVSALVGFVGVYFAKANTPQ